MQNDSTVVDTLTQAYSDVWLGNESVEPTNALIAFMYSNDLIYVVLGVTLIIWSVLLFFMIRVDRKVASLEEKINSEEK
jgi:hypothetical protein